MAMSDHRILNNMLDGDIVIEPFNRDFLSTSSYDVCLGEYFYKERHPEFGNNIFNLYDQEQVKRLWGSPQLAFAVRELPDAEERALLDAGFEPDDRVIMVAPGESILAHTEEFIGGRRHITTMMKARSGTGRSLINVCQCAGWGDVGYVNRWTMEITNRSLHYHIPLLVGARIAQIIFLETGPIEGADYAAKGSYQNTQDLAKLKAEWHPSSMLPKTKRR